MDCFQHVCLLMAIPTALAPCKRQWLRVSRIAIAIGKCVMIAARGHAKRRIRHVRVASRIAHKTGIVVRLIQSIVKAGMFRIVPRVKLSLASIVRFWEESKIAAVAPTTVILKSAIESDTKTDASFVLTQIAKIVMDPAVQVVTHPSVYREEGCSVIQI